MGSNFYAIVAFILLQVCSTNAWSSLLVDRRTAVAAATGSLSAAFVAKARPAIAAAGVSLQTFQDEKTGVAIDIPANWVPSKQQLPDRRTLLLWTDPNNKESLIFIAFTPVRDDFTSLGSFGNVDQVAAQTILPKGKIAGFDVEAKMLSAVSSKQAYFFDYVQNVPGVQPTTHFRTIFTLRQGATGGAGAVLVTITAQTLESRYESELKGLFDQVINSYRSF
ncbi:hypothetical protein ACA910_021680 [Epithemia clementina (nom. ined.)]